MIYILDLILMLIIVINFDLALNNKREAERRRQEHLKEYKKFLRSYVNNNNKLSNKYIEAEKRKNFYKRWII